MSLRQRENLAKYMYDLSKGIVLLAVVGGFVGGQAAVVNVTVGLITAIVLLLIGLWLDGNSSQPS